jgi:hypothetical protein
MTGLEHLLWDMNKTQFDYKQGIQIIVERVVMRGNSKDWQTMYTLYSLESIKDAVKKIPWLPERDMNYVSKLFDIPLTELECYKRKPLNQQLWI